MSMELKEAREIVETVRKYSDENDKMDMVLIVLDDRITELEAQRDELLEALKDILEAFWDMSPLEYAASRGLPCMSDGEGERVLGKARQTIREIKQSPLAIDKE